MEFFALSARNHARNPPGGHASRRKKPRILLSGKRQLWASCETTSSNTIDMLRDGTSFPESCGEERDIGSVLEPVKWVDIIRFTGPEKRLGAIPLLGRARLRVPFIESPL
jgi:hypothetical protein